MWSLAAPGCTPRPSYARVSSAQKTETRVGGSFFTYQEPEPSGGPDDSGLAESVHTSEAVRWGCTQEAASLKAIVRNPESPFRGLKVLNNNLPWNRCSFGLGQLRYLRVRGQT